MSSVVSETPLVGLHKGFGHLFNSLRTQEWQTLMQACNPADLVAYFTHQNSSLTPYALVAAYAVYPEKCPFIGQVASNRLGIHNENFYPHVFGVGCEGTNSFTVLLLKEAQEQLRQHLWEDEYATAVSKVNGALILFASARELSWDELRENYIGLDPVEVVHSLTDPLGRRVFFAYWAQLMTSSYVPREFKRETIRQLLNWCGDLATRDAQLAVACVACALQEVVSYYDCWPLYSIAEYSTINVDLESLVEYLYQYRESLQEEIFSEYPRRIEILLGLLPNKLQEEFALLYCNEAFVQKCKDVKDSSLLAAYLIVDTLKDYVLENLHLAALRELVKERRDEVKQCLQALLEKKLYQNKVENTISKHNVPRKFLLS